MLSSPSDLTMTDQNFSTMFHQLPLNEWVQNGSESPICQLPFTIKQVEQAHGLSFTQCKPQMPEQWHAVVEIEGHVFLLHAARDALAPQSLITVIARGDIRDPAPLLGRVCSAFAILADELPWTSHELSPRQWALWRLDDNGNRTVMWYFPEFGPAESTAQRYMERGHKQLCYVQETF